MQLGLIAQSSFVLDSLESWAVQEGLTVLSKSGLVVHLEGDLHQMEAAFRVTFERWQDGWHTKDNPALPPGAVAVSGLSTKGRLYPHLRARKLDNPVPPLVTNGPHPGLTPDQVNTAYGVTGSADGTGHTLGIAAWGVSFQQSDIDAFCTALTLPSCTPTVVPISGYTNTFNASDGPETTLDIGWAHAMAPGAAIRVYMAPAGANDVAWALNVTTLLNTVLTDSVPLSALNISYGDGEDQFPASDLTAWETLIAAITQKGTVVTVSSGDQGAYGLHMPMEPQIPRVDAPASCPSAVAVGGTALYMKDLTFETEWAWSNDVNFGASGGGYSTVFTAPAYQAALKHSMRGVPDIAGPASVTTEAFLIYNGAYYLIGGTSWAAPVLAGLCTRLAQAKGSGLGDIHATLYQHGSAICRDITVGNNSCYAVMGYYAEPGWDACTGWGSPHYPAWLSLLSPGGAHVSPINPATLSVAQLATAPDGAYGSANTPLQEAARTIETALGSANFFGFCHQPTGYFDAAQKAAFTLWTAGVRH